MEKSHLEKQVGNGFALFLALYPWIAAAIVAKLYEVYRQQSAAGVISPTGSPIDFFGGVLFSALLILGFILLPVGVAMWAAMLDAWRRGFANGWWWGVCSVLAFIGIPVSFVYALDWVSRDWS